MEIKRVALLGAGGIGSYFVWGLSEVMGENFCVVAEGDRAERLKRDGLTINGQQVSLHVKAPSEVGDCDLLIVAVKYYGLKAVLKTIKEIVGPQTIIISLLNGIDSEEVIAGAVGKERLIYSMIRFSVQRQGSSAVFDPNAAEGLFYGEPDTPEKTERILALERFFGRTKIRSQAVPNVVEMQWKKYLLNISGNLPQAVLGVGYGAYFDSEHAAFIRCRLQEEVKVTAAAFGIDLVLPDPTKAVFGKAVRFSTLQDLDAGRQTEVDMFLGVLIEKAASQGIDLPYAKYTYHAIKALEEKNDGKFNY